MVINNKNLLKDIKQTVIIKAPIQKVWDIVSTSEGIASWFMPNDFKPIVGYEFHIESPYGSSPCEVLEIIPLKRISFTWDTDGWIVTFILKEINDYTEFTLIHGGWKEPTTILPKANEESSIVHKTMDGGWRGIVHKLVEVVEI